MGKYNPGPDEGQPEVVITDDDDVDTGQPAAGTQEPIGNWFEIPESEWSQLPAGVQSHLDEYKKQWEAAYTKKRMAETGELKRLREESAESIHKAKQFDALVNNPVFQKFILAQQQGGAQQGTAVQQNAGSPDEVFSDIEFDEYEEGDVFKKMLRGVAQIVESKITERLGPLQQWAQQGQEKSEFDRLQQEAAMNKWAVTPNEVKDEIYSVRAANPNLSLHDAYFQVVGMRSIVKPTVNITDEIPKLGNRPNPLIKPGTRTSSRTSPVIHETALDRAVAGREIKGNVGMDARKLVEEAIAELTQQGKIE